MQVVEAQTSGLPCIISDVIPSEVVLVPIIKQVSLKDSASIWAKKVLEYSEGYEREDMSKDIIKAGYDVKEVSERLIRFYKCLYIG